MPKEIQEQDPAEVKDLQETDELEDSEIVDPGQNEGKPKRDPNQDKIGEDHPRFQKIYAQNKQRERENDALKKEMESLRGESEQARKAFQDHNQKLIETIERMSTKDSKEVSVSIEDVEAAIEQVEGEMDKAFEDGDFAKGMRLQTKVNKMMRQHMKGPDITKMAKQIRDEVATEVSAKAEGQIIFNSWVKDNQWYNEDPVAKAAADNMGVEMVRNGKPYAEALQEISKQITKKFGFDRQTRKKDYREVAAVDSGNGTKGNLGSRKLTEDESKMAKMFGMTDQEMLKQIVLAERGKN